MKLDWTRRRTKVEKWQKGAFGSTLQIDLDSIRSEFDLNRAQVEETLAELGVERVVFWEGNDPTQAEDTLLTLDQWKIVAHSNS